MNVDDELIGAIVLVHPDVIKDPARMPNQIGIVTNADFGGDNIHVSFGKKGMFLFSTDALLIMKSTSDIFFNLKEHGDSLRKDDEKSLLTIALLLEYKQSKTNIKTAMELAKKSDDVRQLSMDTIDDAYYLRYHKAIER